MSDTPNRNTWTTRINVSDNARGRLEAMAKQAHVSVATMIGITIETYVTARSTG